MRNSLSIRFWTLAGLFLMLFFASAAATPLYRVYQERFGFSATTLTAVFAVYVFVLLVTLLFLGSISDYLGRLPVVVAGLALSAAACLVFLMAHDVSALYLARALQGVATGLASGAIGAALIDLEPQGSQRGPLVSSSFSTLGLGLGALLTSFLVEYGKAPTHLIWWALLTVFVAGTIATLVMAEPGTKRPGALSSLRPTIAVPPQTRATFAETIPCLIAGWALNGLFLSLGPSIAAEASDSTNRVWGGLVIFLLCGTAAAVGLLFRAIDPRRGMLIGCLFLLAGVVITLISITATASAALLGGAAVAGVGLGLAFQGTFRMTMALAAPEERAGLLAAIFTVGYLAFSVPALIAGVATTRVGLHETAVVYSASLVVLVAAAVVLIALRSDGRSAEAGSSVLVAVPPGPCTVPPCLQTFGADDERLRVIPSEVRSAVRQSQTIPQRHVQDEGGRP